MAIISVIKFDIQILPTNFNMIARTYKCEASRRQLYTFTKRALERYSGPTAASGG